MGCLPYDRNIANGSRKSIPVQSLFESNCSQNSRKFLGKYQDSKNKMYPSWVLFFTFPDDYLK